MTDLEKTPRRLRSLPGWVRFAVPCLIAVIAIVALFGGRALFASVPRAGLERALAAQRALVEERPADATVREDLGSLLVLAEDLPGAEAAFREAVAIDPASATAHFQLGGVLEKLGHEKKALHEYLAAIELDPAFAWAHYEAGSIYHHRGQTRRAKNYYAKALGLDPTLADPQVNPHILENSLATSAMILAYRQFTPETSAPPTFHEPARIAGLIIERPKSGDELAEEKPKEEPAAEEGSGGYARVTSGAPGRQAHGGAAEKETGEPEKVITSRDLDTGSHSGQVVGGTAVGSVGGSRGGKTSADTAAERAKAREAARAASRPAHAGGGATYPQNPMFQPPGATTGGGGGTTGGGGTFKPAPESTGRIDVRLEETPG